MTASVSELESSLADLRDLPLSDITSAELTVGLAERIMPQTEVSAFNSSI